MRFDKILDISILLGYIGLIYSTLSVAPAAFTFAAKALGPHLGTYINMLIAAVIAAISFFFYPRLKDRSWKVYPGLLAIFFIYVIILGRYTPIVSEKMHLIEYGLVGYFALRVFRDVRSRDARYILTILVIVIAGSCDEFIQRILPNRVYELKDIYMNVLSGLLGLALLRLLGHADAGRPTGFDKLFR